MIPRVTHARLPEGRQDFKLRAKSGVRLSKSADLYDSKGYTHTPPRGEASLP